MSQPRNATTTARGRTYKWRDETFDSVTTILNGGIPKPALTNWAAKTVAEYAVAHLDQVIAIAADDPAAAIDLLKGSPYRDRDAAAVKGSDIHAAAEAHILGQPQPEWPKDIAPSMEQFERFVADYSPTFELSEASVFSRQHRYAGTLDSIMVIGGRRILVDFKSGKGVYADQVAPQVAAYRFADFIGLADGTEQPMPAVDECAVLHIRPRSYQLLPVVADEAVFRLFLYAQQVNHWCKETSRSALLAPLGPADFALAEEVA